MLPGDLNQRLNTVILELRPHFVELYELLSDSVEVACNRKRFGCQAAAERLSLIPVTLQRGVLHELERGVPHFGNRRTFRAWFDSRFIRSIRSRSIWSDRSNRRGWRRGGITSALQLQLFERCQLLLSGF